MSKLSIADLPKLYTFSVSHYSEKARWALDYSDVMVNEKPLTPVLHIAGLLRLGPNNTVPVLVGNDRVIQNSTEIMLWADEQNPAAKLFGDDAASREKILEIIDHHDALGFAVMRYCYSFVIDDKPTLIMAFTWASSLLQTAAIKASYPVVKRLMKKSMNITPETAIKSLDVLFAHCDEVQAAVEKTGFLYGKSLTAADIAVASLLAPLAGPGEHPVYKAMAPVVRPKVGAIGDHAVMDWVRNIYSQYRYQESV